jgi:lipopolysaccharide transport system ATP-binding protein
MNEVSKGSGRTVLFVSHNMGAISQLCSKCVMLEKGKLIAYAETNKCIDIYIGHSDSNEAMYKCETALDTPIYFEIIFLANRNQIQSNEFLITDSIIVNFKLSYNILKEKNSSYSIFCTITDNAGTPVFSSESSIVNSELVQMQIPAKFLVRGFYKITAFIHKPNVEQIDRVDDVCPFQIIDNESPFVVHGEYNYGFVFSNCEWQYK